MKTLFFILLKIAEILGAIFIPYQIGSYILNGPVDAPMFAKWFIGLLVIIVIGSLLYLIKYFLPKWWNYNWKLADMLNKSIEKDDLR